MARWMMVAVRLGKTGYASGQGAEQAGRPAHWQSFLLCLPCLVWSGVICLGTLCNTLAPPKNRSGARALCTGLNPFHLPTSICMYQHTPGISHQNVLSTMAIAVGASFTWQCMAWPPQNNCVACQGLQLACASLEGNSRTLSSTPSRHRPPLCCRGRCRATRHAQHRATRNLERLT